MITRTKDKPNVNGTKRSDYNAVNANCKRERSTTSNISTPCINLQDFHFMITKDNPK